jgi:hypothetical protein
VARWRLEAPETVEELLRWLTADDRSKVEAPW